MSWASRRRVWIAAEVGINHNGDRDTAIDLIDAAADAGADAVKFQVGDPRKYVNRDRWEIPRATPWGVMPYIAYRERMELEQDELELCFMHARAKSLAPFASPLNVEAVARLEELECSVYKVASPMMVKDRLLRAIRDTVKPVILSTGMSTLAQIDYAVEMFEDRDLAILHCTSAYPCPPEQNNLRMIETLRARYGVPVGYSGHEIGVPESIAAVALGARIVERHLTLSRAMWGSDHAASLEPTGLRKLVKYIRTVEKAMGDGVKRVYDSERANMAKFRPLACTSQVA